METQIAFERLFTRFPDLELAIPRSNIRWTKRIGMRALQSLPARLNRRNA
jgi:cytochrome P450